MLKLMGTAGAASVMVACGAEATAEPKPEEPKAEEPAEGPKEEAPEEPAPEEPPAVEAAEVVMMYQASEIDEGDIEQFNAD